MPVVGATTAQQAQLADFVQLQRSAIVQLWKLNKTISALVQIWNANILEIIGTPQNSPITDNTGYAGAVQLTDTQVTMLFGVLQSLQTGTMTPSNMAAFVLATGPDSML